MNDYTPETSLKRCGTCKQEKPATSSYFGRDKHRCDGLCNSCKECRRQYREANRDNQKEWFKQYRIDNRDSLRAKDKARYPLRREQDKAARKRQKDRNPERIKILNHERYLRLKPSYHAANHIRRARRLSLPTRWNKKYWAACLEYFRYRCAVCGAQLRDLFGNVEPNADHWIPLTYKGGDNPGTVRENMVCLCNDCNLNKFNKMPEQWLIDRYGKRKAGIILNRVLIYFEWTSLQ